MAEDKTETKYERAIRSQWAAIVTALAIALTAIAPKPSNV